MLVPDVWMLRSLYLDSHHLGRGVGDGEVEPATVMILSVRRVPSCQAHGLYPGLAEVASKLVELAGSQDG